MKKLSLTCALLLISLTSACSGGAPTQEEAVGTKQKADGRQSQELQNQALRNQIEQIASAAKGRVGVAAVVLETEESVSLNPYPQIAQIPQRGF